MIENVGSIKVPAKKLNKQLLNYLYNVIRNAKCDQIDVYYADGNLYIGADSLDTHLVSFYKIILDEQTVSTVETVVTDEALDFGSEDFSDLIEGDVFIEGDIVPKVVGFEDAPQPNQVEVDELPDELPDEDYEEEDDEELYAFDVQPKAVVKEVKASSTVDGTGNMIYFSTLTEFIQALLIEDSTSQSVEIIIEENIVYIKGADYSFNYPKVKGLVEIEYYLDVMRNKTWEKVNVEAVQKVAKATSSTSINRPADMYVAMEKDKVYSDNLSLLICASSWRLNQRYHFTYETLPALTKLPVSGNSEDVYVSKGNGLIFLRVGELYLAWTNNDNQETENLLGQVNIESMESLVTINDKVTKRLKLFEKMIGSINVDKDKTVQFKMIENGLMSVGQDDNVIFCKCPCNKGVEMTADISAILQAMALSNSKEPTLKSDLLGKETKYLLIRGSLDILIQVEGIKR